MARNRSYWTYSMSCFAVWAVVLAVATAKRKNDTKGNHFLVFGGWVIAWVSGTIARFVYPPPQRWLEASSSP